MRGRGRMACGLSSIVPQTLTLSSAQPFNWTSVVLKLLSCHLRDEKGGDAFNWTSVVLKQAALEAAKRSLRSF